MASRSIGLLAAVSCATWLIAAPCLAHIDLELPTPRAAGRPDSNLGERPCGQRQNARQTDRLNVFRPGETIDVLVDVYVQHPSYFRFAFDADGDDSFSARPSTPSDPTSDDPTTLPAGEGEQILGYVQDPTGDIERIEQRLTLPNVECDNCTLQLTQFIYGLPLADSTYYQCADIVLTGPPVPPPADPDSADVATDADDDSTGCTLAPTARTPTTRGNTPSAILLALIGAACWRRRLQRPA